MTVRFSSALVLVSSFVAALGCSAGSPPGSGAHTGDGGAGDDLMIPPSGGDTTNDPNDTRDVPVREKTCDAAGNCTCLRLALLGTLASAAVDSDSDAFVTWLNSKSEGTATLSKVPTK